MERQKRELDRLVQLHLVLAAAFADGSYRASAHNSCQVAVVFALSFSGICIVMYKY